VERVEKPEGCVRGMVKPFVAAFRRHIRDQTILYIVGEGANDPSGFVIATRRQGQAFKADHRVAAPIGEPMVARDNGAHVVAGGTGARSVSDTPGGSDDELIGG